jgi:hypothetical protein
MKNEEFIRNVSDLHFSYLGRQQNLVNDSAPV